MKALSYKEAMKRADVHVAQLKSDIDGDIYEGDFICTRINMNTIPEGKFGYECRHDDYGNEDYPATIETGTVGVNFCGVLITDEEIIFPEGQDYIPVRCVFIEG